MLEFSLDKEYQQAQFENLSGLMATNYGIESIKIQKEQEKERKCSYGRFTNRFLWL